ncbi:HXXXD-type acyl-transferase family protein [Prunus dulcis]|uniref:HXXXD-type acyl-transferase family protein n=1 Tax=Prunus dulcis TaxID=3755 RepID=A0A4Y1R814_PRUDU|nr:HXXXD-type acyl-transferase family protein [Prunus dulcis]
MYGYINDPQYHLNYPKICSGSPSPSPPHSSWYLQNTARETVERFAHDDKGDFATSLKHFRVKTSTEE